MAEADLKRKQEALAKMADYATKYDVERMQAVLEISRLHLEITNQKKEIVSIESHVFAVADGSA